MNAVIRVVMDDLGIWGQQCSASLVLQDNHG